MLWSRAGRGGLGLGGCLICRVKMQRPQTSGHKETWQSSICLGNLNIQSLGREHWSEALKWPHKVTVGRGRVGPKPLRRIGEQVYSTTGARLRETIKELVVAGDYASCLSMMVYSRRTEVCDPRVPESTREYPYHDQAKPPT